MRAVTTAPLINFDSKAGQVTFEVRPGLNVTLLPDWLLDEDSLPSELSEFQSYVLLGGGHNRMWCLSVTTDCSEASGNDLNSRSLVVDTCAHSGERIVDRTLVALRLLRTEKVFAPLIWTVVWDQYDQCVGSSVSNHGTRWDALEEHLLGADADPIHWSAADLFPHPYVLDTSSKLDVDRILQGIVEAESFSQRNSRRLDLASRRFNAAYDRSRPEDQLIDLFIALEALYVDSQERVTDQLATRASRHLESRSETISALSEDLRGSYRVRGEVVHGRTEIGSVRGAISVAEDVLRKGLSRFISNPSSFDVILSIPAIAGEPRSKS